MSLHDPTDEIFEKVAISGYKVSRGVTEIFSSNAHDNEEEQNELEEAAKKIIQKVAKGKRPKKEELDLKYFNNLTDWLMALLMIGTLKAFPDFTPKQVVGLSKELFRQLATVEQEGKWTKTLGWMERKGMKSALAQVMLELSRGYWD